MCIAVYKPAGQKIPSNKIFENCFSNNDDGAGFMFAYKGKVYIEKGFMTFNAFKKALKQTIKKYGGGNRCFDLPMVFHFRITSQGGVKPELTHPYPLSSSYEEMKKTSNTCDIAIAHNGIIHATSSYLISDHNDTMEFIKEIMYPLIDNNKYYQNKNVMAVFKYLLEGNRFAIMDGKGHVELIGDWKHDDGIFYSNNSYSYKKTTLPSGYYSGVTKYPSSNTKSRWYEYEEEDDTNPDYYTGAGIYRQLSASQVDTLYADEQLLCGFCGEHMCIEYDETIDAYIAICPECGEIYVLDDETAVFAISKGIGYEGGLI